MIVALSPTLWKWNSAVRHRFVIAMAAAGLCLTTGPAVAEKRVALVIGNAAYRTAPLSNPVNDAHDMAEALRQVGFEVIEKTNATQKEMLRAITQFGEKLRADSVALFFYAGHGMQVKGKNFLVPIDAQIASEASVRAEAVDVDNVMDQLSVSTLNIVILDACRNNPFERKFRSVGGGLAQMDAPKGSLIAYATAPGKTAADGDGRNGLYTQELLKHIRTSSLPVESVFKRVRIGVMQASGDGQTPWESSSLTGEFFFRREAPANSPPVAPSYTLPPPNAKPRTTEQIEDDLWANIRDSNRAQVFEEYIRGYPRGRYLTQAKVKLVSLRPSDGPVEPLPAASSRISAKATNRPAGEGSVDAASKGTTGGDVTTSSENGRVSLVAKARGSSQEADMLVRRTMAHRKALSASSKRLQQLLVQRYGMSAKEAEETVAAGEVVGAEYSNDAKEIEVRYKVVFQTAGR
ncbi:MAG: caspase domain-containing protein [Sterolibacteriaceae bacterium MAG5]|nr:caspase domain-containing protein [Candidatus Nitricoxidireducens bremensis]